MSNLRDAIVRMALRRPYLYLLVTLVISIVLMEVLVEIAEHTFIKPALQQLLLVFIQQAKRQAVSLSSLFMRWWYFKSGTETHF